MHEETLKELYEPFELKSRKGVGGKTFNYVPSDDIVDRMNRVFQGNWTTEVMEAKIIEDHVIMRVRVTVTDPKSDSEEGWFFQEGYASQQVARYTFGDNVGKILDIGNSYKSAMSKAIKTAVAKWGVALHLINKEAGQPGPSPTAAPLTPIPSDMIIRDKVDPLNTVPAIKNVPSGPPPIEDRGKVETSVSAPPVFTNDNIVEPRTAPPTEFTPPTDGTSRLISDVQKVAVETIMSVHNVDFNTLATEVLGQTGDVPEALDKVRYHDAVKLIQYGNNL